MGQTDPILMFSSQQPPGEDPAGRSGVGRSGHGDPDDPVTLATPARPAPPPFKLRLPAQK